MVCACRNGMYVLPAGSKNKQRRASSQALPHAMGNLFATPLPETAEFAAEFLRVQAAVAASACSPLQLKFVELKIVCAQVRVAGGAEGVHGASLASGAPYGAGAGAGAGTSGNLAMTAEYQPAAGMRRGAGNGAQLLSSDAAIPVPGPLLGRMTTARQRHCHRATHME
ncbi:hypothetical protein ACK3TF_003105 [Chlorella vulgaris]